MDSSNRWPSSTRPSSSAAVSAERVDAEGERPRAEQVGGREHHSCGADEADSRRGDLEPAAGVPTLEGRSREEGHADASGGDDGREPAAEIADLSLLFVERP
jgi:hypothetical protein